MTLILRTGAVTDIGLVRSNNEDCAFVGRRLLVVADGMGGLPAGELASELLVQALAGLDEMTDLGDPLPALRAAVHAGNQDIRSAAAGDEAREGMGTTVTALLLADDELALLNVGDSRCYRVRDGQLTQLTRDDTYVQALVDQGALSPADARRHPQRALVTKAVQGEPLAPAGMVLKVQPGDRYLLCSDGLSDYVDDDLIDQTLRSYPDPQQCAGELVKRALAVGAPDNVTVIVADIATD
ncbi:MAG TPA: protein phosphatase 2C domain-containing protein [Catenuloplanes sp.]|jgi:protein phosphatase